MKIAAKILALCFLFQPCFAAELDYSKAEEFYRAGDWAKATEAYKGAIEPQLNQNTAAPWLLYNYGTALLKTGANIEAYSFLLKAFYLSPLDSDIRHNLKMAAEKIPEPTKSIRPSTWVSWWPDMLRPAPTSIWLSISLLFTALFFWWVNAKDKSLGYTFLGVGILFGIISAVSFSQNATPAGVLLKDSKIRSGPDAKFQEITTVVGGAIVNLEERRDAWVKIRYLNGEQETVGWLEAPTVLVIN